MGEGHLPVVTGITDVCPAFEEGGTSALRFGMCRFVGRAEFLRTAEKMKVNSTIKD